VSAAPDNAPATGVTDTTTRWIRVLVCFLVSGVLAYLAVRCLSHRATDWRIAVVNLAGCVAFGISAVAGYVMPSPGARSIWPQPTRGRRSGRCAFSSGHCSCCPRGSAGTERACEAQSPRSDDFALPPQPYRRLDRTSAKGARMWWGIGGFGILLYLVLLFVLGVTCLRKGHWIMFILGIFVPLFWIIGAVIPPTRPQTV
jgi:hypothetical protein